jgi:hypothetical protein
MERLVDAETGAILFRNPTLRGIPDLVVEGDGYTVSAGFALDAGTPVFDPTPEELIRQDRAR